MSRHSRQQAQQTVLSEYKDSNQNSFQIVFANISSTSTFSSHFGFTKITAEFESLRVTIS